jgi:hypothetical protein
MGQALFFQGTNNIARNPATYLILNGLAVIILLVDLIYRRTPVGREDRRQDGTRELDSPFLSLAVDVAGIAAYCYLAWASLTILATLNPPYVLVDIHQWGLPGIHYLQDLNLVLALAFTAVALALAVMQGLFVNVGVRREGRDEMFWRQLLRVARTAAWDGLGSMRLVLGPLIWLIPAYTIGQFAIQTTDYFRQVATKKGQGIGELFNPFSANSLDNFGRGLLVLVLALIAVALVIVASVIVEHDFALLRSTLAMLRDAARALTLILALFLVSLAVINAVAVIVAGVSEPFQLGAAALVAVILAIVPPVFERVRRGVARRR